jgi:N-acetylglucosaminyl-diphospho-decaprenol L-rhamnosyltransferase
VNARPPSAADPATDPATDLAIVVVNYGSHDLLERNLATVSQHSPEAQVIVVDNYTSLEERQQVRNLCARHGWHALLMDDNLGFGTGVNRAVAELGATVCHLLLLNPDATITPDALQRLRRHVAEHPMDLVAPTVRAPDGTHWSSGTDLYLDRGESRSWQRREADLDLGQVQPWLSGACLMLGRALWDRVGGFDDDYFLYWEDVDFSRRVQEAGGRLVVDPEAVATHDEGATHRGDTAARAKSSTYYYYNTRNRLLFAAKHLAPADQRRWRRTAAVMGYRILLQGGRRQLAHPTRTIVPALRGTYDGLRLMRARRRHQR